MNTNMLMYGCGKENLPLTETADLLEEIALEFIQGLLHNTTKHLVTNRISCDDILITLRKVL